MQQKHTYVCTVFESIVNEPTGPLNSQNMYWPINYATTEATARHSFTYCLLMMHSWASRSRCCAWEACSESSSGVVHPAEPSVASSWGPVTQTQGMESQSAHQQTQSIPLLVLLSLSQMSGYLAIRLSGSRAEATEDRRHKSRDEGRTE